ncbi:MAG: hypothetical protein MUC48_09365 [Leptolyngbya sp. Prado105]|nr:hypothetical protein [Leptolyngbya sp. Prado105]
MTTDVLIVPTVAENFWTVGFSDRLVWVLWFGFCSLGFESGAGRKRSGEILQSRGLC